MTTAAFCAALCLVVAGVAFIHWPTALIVAGVLGGALAFFLEAAKAVAADPNNE